MDERSRRLTSDVKSLLEDARSPRALEAISREDLARRVAFEVGEAARNDSQGRSYAPDQYTVSLHPGALAGPKYELVEAQNVLSEAIARALRSSGYLLVRDPNITLASDPTLGPAEVRVIAWHSGDPLIFSKETGPVAEDPDRPPPGAFLVVEGRKFPLSLPIVNIGRRLDNDLVLDDPHVSRRHAQLRAHHGRFTLYDLQSTAGTRVNGQLISQKTLRPGDVILVGAVQLIYGEDAGGPPGPSSPYTPPARPDIDRDQVTPLHLRLPRWDTRPIAKRGEPHGKEGPSKKEEPSKKE